MSTGLIIQLEEVRAVLTRLVSECRAIATECRTAADFHRSRDREVVAWRYDSDARRLEAAIEPAIPYILKEP